MGQKISSVMKSRRGISYQDKYVLLVFLEGLIEDLNCESDICLLEANTEFSYGRNLSLDIRMLFSEKEVIYEVKTGKAYKDDKKEIGKSLDSLYEYAQGRLDLGEPIEIRLVITPEFREKIMSVWSQLLHINEAHSVTKKNFYGKTVASSIKDLIEKLDLKKLTKKNFESFVKKMKIEVGPKDELRDGGSEIDDRIRGRIRMLLKKCRCENNEVESPVDSIQLELIDVVRLSSEGRVTDFKKSMIDKLIQCFARKKILENASYKQEFIFSNEISGYEKDIKSLLTKESEPGEVSATNSMEGKPLGENNQNLNDIIQI